MSLESRVSDLKSKLAPIGRVVAGVFPRARREPSKTARADGEIHDAGEPGLEARDAGLETFFDPEFLKKLEHLRLVAKRLSWASAKGEHASARKGFSLEFSDYRRYQQGDDLRYVDWNVYRRLDRLLVKVFTAEEEMSIYLLVDVSRSMGEGVPRKIDYAKKIAASLGYIGLKNLDRVGGAAFSSSLQGALTAGRGRGQVLKLFRFVTELSCGGETNFRGAIQSFGRLFPHPGLVIIVSDFFDPEGWRAALEDLASKKHQLLLIHVVAEEEIHPQATGDVALVDVEDGRQRKFYLDAEMAQRFGRELDGYFAAIEALCARRGIEYLRTTTAVPFDDFVLRTLRQASSVT